MKLRLPFKRKKSASCTSSSTSLSSKSSSLLRSSSLSPADPSTPAAEFSGAAPLQATGGSLHDQRPELEEAFRVFDRDGDGKISVSEIACVLKMLGDNPSEQELDYMVKAADKDGDGFIDLEEFINLNSSGQSQNEELKDAFNIFDADKDGFISVEELYGVLRSLGENCSLQECCRMIKSVDEDGNGLVDFKEFRKMMSRTR